MYAEFTTNASVMQYGSEQAEHYYDSEVPADYSLEDPGNYMSGGQYEDPNCRYTSERLLAQDQVDGQSQYEPNHTQYQSDGHLYRPDEYVDFLLQR